MISCHNQFIPQTDRPGDNDAKAISSRYDLCDCGEWKRDVAKTCGKCRWAKFAGSKICACGKRKLKKSKVCQDCHRQSITVPKIAKGDENISEKLAENKAALVAARRAGNDELAKVLSAEREELKKRGRRLDPCRLHKSILARSRRVALLGRPRIRKDGQAMEAPNKSNRMICACGRVKNSNAVKCAHCEAFRRSLRAMMAALVLFLMTLNGWGQGLMPTNVLARPSQVNTNVLQVDGRTMDVVTGPGAVHPYGIVGWTTPAGSTNPVIVQLDSQVYQAGNATIITDPDHHEHLQIWRYNNYLWTTDLMNWTTNVGVVYSVYDLPDLPYQYFKFSMP